MAHSNYKLPPSSSWLLGATLPQKGFSFQFYDRTTVCQYTTPAAVQGQMSAPPPSPPTKLNFVVAVDGVMDINQILH